MSREKDISIKQLFNQVPQPEPQQTSVLEAFKPAKMVSPMYLVVLVEPITISGKSRSKTSQAFVAVSYDAGVMFAQCTGFWAYGSVEDITKEYAGLAETTDPAQYIQVALPWGRVSYTQSLSYRHKVRQ
jgi:hypothetical protein